MAQLAELETYYRTPKAIRVRTRAQMIWLSAEQHFVPHPIAAIVRKDEQTVRRWIRRYQAKGVRGVCEIVWCMGFWGCFIALL